MSRLQFAARVPPALGALALAIVATGCASSGAVPHPFPTPGIQDSRDSQGSRHGAHPSGLPAEAIAATALSFQGVPYRDGGTDPRGFDCSGFTQYVFSQYGVRLPRGVREQFQQGTEVQESQLAPGDLVFFATTGRGPTHVAIIIGERQFVHAPSSTGVVRVERLNAGYWSARYLGARRLTAASASEAALP